MKVNVDIYERYDSMSVEERKEALCRRNSRSSYLNLGFEGVCGGVDACTFALLTSIVSSFSARMRETDIDDVE